MKKQLLLFVILVFLRISFCNAQVGDVCTSPYIASLCDSSTFSTNTSDFKNDVSKWVYNGDTIYAYGQDMYYEIKLPVSSYQPVNLYASFLGYFYPACSGCFERINFLWFTNSPCSSSPVAVDQLSLSGTSSFQDSILVNFPIITIQPTYYLVVDFTNQVNYQYNLKLGFSNNQPLPQTTCSTASPPYKGNVELDSSNCYSSSNPYHLPLASLNDNPADSNLLLPFSLNQDLKYLPVSDDNENGFVLTIKTTEYNSYNSAGHDTVIEIYKSFDQFPYAYSSAYGGSVSYSYDVAFSLFMKNSTGISGLKGFRIQVPSGVGNSFGLPTGKGMYDTSGRWSMNYNGGISTYTWLFNGNGGRGDDTGLNSYYCRVYTFDAQFGNISEGINAWYLPDNFGNDSMVCVLNASNPPRTDCGIVPTDYEQGWVPLFPPGSGSGGVGGITGQWCGSDIEEDLGPQIYPCNYYSGKPIRYSVVNIDDNGCANEVDYYYDEEGSDFTFNDPFLKYGGGDDEFEICPKEYYNLVLNGNGNYNSYFTPSTLVFVDSNNVYHPVDSLGQIQWNEDYYSLNIPYDLPIYPNSSSTDSFIVPLSYPGHYTIIFSVYDSSTNSYSPSCPSGDLYIYVFSSIDSNFTWTNSDRVVTFAPDIYNISPVDSLYLHNQGISYQWNFGDGESSHNYNLIHTYSGTDTSYDVCFSIYFNYSGGINCPNTLCKTVDIGLSGVDNLSNPTNIQVYPNPFDDYLLIKAQDKSVKSIELYDVLGRKMLSEDMKENYSDNNVLRLNVSSLQDGMYYVRIKTDGTDYIQNVVKLR